MLIYYCPDILRLNFINYIHEIKISNQPVRHIEVNDLDSSLQVLVNTKDHVVKLTITSENRCSGVPVQQVTGEKSKRTASIYQKLKTIQRENVPYNTNVCNKFDGTIYKYCYHIKK